MKPTMALKPLVFAVAAVLAVAVHADNRNDDNHGHGHGHGHGHDQHHPKPPYDPYKDPRIQAGASATVEDTQDSSYNSVLNQGTKNNAGLTNSLNNQSSGNIGANVAAGDMNQQANAAALATADEKFIFGTAYASTSVTQNNTDNSAWNYSTTNNAKLDNSGNGAQGNIGLNVAAGNFNQQKNDMAAAVSGGREAEAYSGASQTSAGNTVENYGVETYKKETLRAEFSAHGTYKGSGQGYVLEDQKKGGHGGHDGGHDNYSSNNDDRGHGDHGKVEKDPLYFTESGTVDLRGYASYQVLVPDGWKDPVTNTASLNGSLNGISGNVGVNVAAGVGNQQSNSLSIAAGCKACTGL